MASLHSINELFQELVVHREFADLGVQILDQLVYRVEMSKGWRQKQHEAKRRFDRRESEHEPPDDRDPGLYFIDKLPSTESDGCVGCGTTSSLVQYYIREDDWTLLARTVVFLCDRCSRNVWDLRAIRADRLLRFRRPGRVNDSETPRVRV